MNCGKIAVLKHTVIMLEKENNEKLKCSVYHVKLWNFVVMGYLLGARRGLYFDFDVISLKL